MIPSSVNSPTLLFFNFFWFFSGSLNFHMNLAQLGSSYLKRTLRGFCLWLHQIYWSFWENWHVNNDASNPGTSFHFFVFLSAVFCSFQWTSLSCLLSDLSLLRVFYYKLLCSLSYNFWLFVANIFKYNGFCVFILYPATLLKLFFEHTAYSSSNCFNVFANSIFVI